MGSFNFVEALLVFGFFLTVATFPLVLIIWAVRSFSRARKRDAEILQRLEALEAREPQSRGTA